MALKDYRPLTPTLRFKSLPRFDEITKWRPAKSLVESKKKSGDTIERRDQVLIGFFAPELFILSIFSKRCDSTKGPFFNDLAIKIKLLFAPAFEDETIARLVFAACFKSFGQLSPWTDGVMSTTAALRFPLAAAHRMIDWVHRHAAHV